VYRLSFFQNEITTAELPGYGGSVQSVEKGTFSTDVLADSAGAARPRPAAGRALHPIPYHGDLSICENKEDFIYNLSGAAVIRQLRFCNLCEPVFACYLYNVHKIGVIFVANRQKNCDFY